MRSFFRDTLITIARARNGLGARAEVNPVIVKSIYLVVEAAMDQAQRNVDLMK